MKDAIALRRPARRAIAAAMAGIAGLLLAGTAHAGMPVTEEDVTVATADGKAEAWLFYPAAKGKWPEVLLWPDMVGPRPAFRDLARRFAAEGYVVLLPNAFYRSVRPGDAEIDPWDKEIRPTLMQYRAAVTEEALAHDVAAYVAFLDKRPQAKRGKVAAVGYDLGGAYALRSAAAMPDRIAAVGSIYGLGLVTAKPDSPHLLLPMTRATYYVAITQDDDKREPEDTAGMREGIAQNGLKGEVAVLPVDHGFANPAGKTYNAASAADAFRALVDLLKRTIG